MEQSNQLGDTGHPMGLVITIVLLGLLASLCPATIVVFILLLATTRAKVNAAAFLIGWGVSLVLFTVVSTATVGLTLLYFARRPGDAQQHLEALRDRVVRAGPTTAVVVYLMVGLYLIADGVRGVVNS